MKLIKFSLTPPIVAISVLFASLCACGATKRYVSKDGSYGADVAGAECYTTLQDAIKACVAGDTVWVKDGFECTPEDGVDTTDGDTSTIRITVQITLRGETGNWQTGPIIRGRWDGDTLNKAVGPNAARCLYNEARSTKVIGFRLLNGATVSGGYGGGMYSKESSVVVTNCFIANCAAGYGGGVSLKSASLYSSVVSNCYCSSQASGVYWPSKTVDTLIIHNSGGPAWNYSGNSSTTIRRCRFIENKTSSVLGNPSNGSDTRTSVYDTDFIGNTSTAAKNGLVYGFVDLYGCVFTGNKGGTTGGCVTGGYIISKKTYVNTNSVTCTRCVFTNNLNTSSSGSIGYLAKFTNCRIENNEGGATRPLYGCDAYNTLIAGNKSTAKGGAIYAAGEDEYVNCTIVGNESKNGPTAYVSANSTLTLVNTIVAKNSATAADSYTSATTCFFDSDGDPKLVKAGKEFSFWPKPKSPCIGTGTVLEWMSDETDARSKDLAGLPRLTDGKVNIGCYEGIATMPGLLLLLR